MFLMQKLRQLITTPLVPVYRLQISPAKGPAERSAMATFRKVILGGSGGPLPQSEAVFFVFVFQLLSGVHLNLYPIYWNILPILILLPFCRHHVIGLFFSSVTY